MGSSYYIQSSKLFHRVNMGKIVIFICAMIIVATSNTKIRFKRANGIGSDIKHESSGLRSTIHGVEYQLQLLMLIMNRKYNENNYFELATEFDPAEKFDDAVLKYNENGKDTYLCIQAKHKIDDEHKTLTLNNLISTDPRGEFNMQKYFNSYLLMKKNKFFDTSDLKEFAIATNIDFAADIKDVTMNFVREVSLDKNHVLHLSEGKFYKMGPDMKDFLIKNFEGASEQVQLIKILFDHIKNKKKMELRNPILSKYSEALFVNNVLDKTTKTLHSDFVNARNNFAQNNKLEYFHNTFIAHIKNKKITMTSLANQKITWSDTFGKVLGIKDLPNDRIDPKDIDDFCDKLIFAVDQPNESKFDSIIKKELSQKYNQIDTERVYNALHVEMFKWLTDHIGRQITLKSAKETFLDIHRKVLSPMVIKTKLEVKHNFVGREDQLKILNLHVVTDKKETVITGSGGIGKTQLAKKFAAEYIKAHPFSNVFWINAESEHELKRSFEDIAKSKQCQINTDGLNTQQIVNEVYNAFKVEGKADKKDFDTLVVFDNALDPKHLYDTYKPPKDDFKVLITSQYSDWNHYAMVHLEGLTEAEATKLVANELNDLNDSEGVKKLVKKLNKFPLALQQAISYIKKKRNGFLGRSYSIDQFQIEFNSKEKEVLDHEYYRKLQGEPYEKTLFTTWEMAKNLIKNERYGVDALSMLNKMSFMPSEIPSQIYLQFFPNLDDSLQLLKEYSLVEYGTDSVNVHNLVQVTTKAKMDLKAKKDTLLEIMQTIKKENIEDLNTAIEAWNNVLKISNQVTAQEHLQSIEAAMIQASIFHDDSKFNDEYTVLENAHNLAVEKKLPIDDNILLLKMQLAESSETLGFHESAKKLYEQVAKIEDSTLLEDKIVLLSVAKSNDKIKNYERAIELHTQFLKSAPDGLDSWHSQISIANAFKELKEYEKSYEQLKKLRSSMQEAGKNTIGIDVGITDVLQHIDSKETIRELTELIKNIQLTGNKMDVNLVTELNKRLNILKGRERMMEESEDMNPAKCLKRGRRRRRNANRCWFSADDVEGFMKNEKIDYKKFVKFLKTNDNEKMNAQLLDLIKRNYVVDHDYESLIKSVTEYGGFDHLNVNERMNSVTHSEHTIPKWKKTLMRSANSIMIAHGAYGSIVTCSMNISSSPCITSVGGIAWSIANLEKGLIKSQVKLFRGIGAGIGALFDVIDIGIQINTLVDCNKRKDTTNPCTEREIRDSIVSLSIDGISVVAGVTFAVLGMTGVGLIVGLALFAIQIIYNGISAVEEFNRKYQTTREEDLSVFWRTALFIDMAHDVKSLASRTELVENHAKTVWAILQNQTTDIKAFGMGLGYIESEKHTKRCGASIILDKERNDIALSRVVPKSIDRNTEMTCLPVSTLKDFEKNIHGHVPSAKYYCENAMVFSDKRRNGTYILLNLELVDIGIISGSNKLNNIFMIYESQKAKVSLSYTHHRTRRNIFDDVGDFFKSIPNVIKDAVTTEFHISDVNSGKVYEPVGLNVFGGNSVTNRFMILSFPTYVRIYGGINSENVIDFSGIGNIIQILYLY